MLLDGVAKTESRWISRINRFYPVLFFHDSKFMILLASTRIRALRSSSPLPIAYNSAAISVKSQPISEDPWHRFTEKYGLWTLLGVSDPPHSMSQVLFTSTVGLKSLPLPPDGHTIGRPIRSNIFQDFKFDFSVCQGCFQLVLEALFLTYA